MYRMRLCVFVVLVCVTAVACNGDAEPTPDGEVPERVVGLVTDVEPEEGTPTGFTVEEDDGDAFLITIDPAHDYGFDLLHVRDHFIQEDPVEVTLEERAGDLVATSIEDVE